MNASKLIYQTAAEIEANPQQSAHVGIGGIRLAPHCPTCGNQSVSELTGETRTLVLGGRVHCIDITVKCCAGHTYALELTGGGARHRQPLLKPVAQPRPESATNGLVVFHDARNSES